MQEIQINIDNFTHYKGNKLKIDECVIIGDQLLTDILGGNKINMYSILVDPITKHETIWTKINRSIEFFVLLYLRLSKKLIKRKYF